MIYIHAFALVNSLGTRPNQIVQALQQESADFLKSYDLPYLTKECYLGAVDDANIVKFNKETFHTIFNALFKDSSEIVFNSYLDLVKNHYSRNNQIFLHLCIQLLPIIAKARSTFSSQRVAIVLGTSTSGLDEGDKYLSYKRQLELSQQKESKVEEYNPNLSSEDISNINQNNTKQSLKNSDIGESNNTFSSSSNNSSNSSISHRTNENFAYFAQEIGDLSHFASVLLAVNGPCFTISTACSSSARALIAAKNLLDTDQADFVIVGGVDSFTRVSIAGFNSLELLSSDVCKPMAKDRHGINIGEGGGLILLSKYVDFWSRINFTEAEQKSLCDFICYNNIVLKGCGESSDAYHVSAPHKEGAGAVKAMQMALNSAKLSPSDIAYVNLHGTASVINDSVEALATAKVFGNTVPCSSTKHLTGHMLGAAGINEAILSCLILEHDLDLPRQLVDYNDIDIDCSKMNLVTKAHQKLKSSYIMSNNFGFGGNNTSLIFAKCNVEG